MAQIGDPDREVVVDPIKLPDRRPTPEPVPTPAPEEPVTVPA